MIQIDHSPSDKFDSERTMHSYSLLRWPQRNRRSTTYRYLFILSDI